MKTFFTIIPLQGGAGLTSHLYKAVDNSKLQMDVPTSFPVMTELHAFAQPGEEIRVLAILSDVNDSRNNLSKFTAELEAMQEKIGFRCPRGVEIVNAPADAGVRSHIRTFQQIIDLVEDNSELYACMTYGTKTLSQLLIMALQYAYRLLDNVYIGCLVYGRIDRENREIKGAYVNDMTALIQLDEITRLLAANRVKDPRAALEQIIEES